MKFQTVFAGGTFDGLHAGHKAFLSRAFAVGQQVVVGVTSSTYIRRSKKHKIRGLPVSSFADRKKNILQWLEQKGWEERATVVLIHSPYEPAASLIKLQALLVTKDNKIRGEKLNRKRVSLGLIPLTLIDVPILPASDGLPISSTRVRNGEIYPSGNLILPQALRIALVSPLGRVLTGAEITRSVGNVAGRCIVAVGDMTTKTMFDLGVVPMLSIIDERVGRKAYPAARLASEKFPLRRIRVKSGPGYIARQAVQAISDVLMAEFSLPIHMRSIIIVNGEEDLLALPAIIYAPVGSVVYYGQPEKGVVEVVVTDEVKKKVASLLAQFE